LVFEGDFAQLAPWGNDCCDARASRYWNLVRKWDLGVASFRSVDRYLLQFLCEIRDQSPTPESLRDFLSAVQVGRSVCRSTLQAAWQRLPGAVVVTAYRDTAKLVNDVGLQLHTGRWLQCITCWQADGSVDNIWLRERVPVQVTRNYDLELGIVNGALGIVLDVSAAGLVLEMSGMRIVTLSPRAAWVERDGNTKPEHHYDISLGFAQTCHKAEGATFEQVIVCMEGWRVAGWCYTALSRARSLSTLAIIGDPCPADFVPRDGTVTGQ
jgi:hypothetical protein